MRNRIWAAAWWIGAVACPVIIAFSVVVFGGHVYQWEILVWMANIMLWAFSARQWQKTAANWEKAYRATADRHG